MQKRPKTRKQHPTFLGRYRDWPESVVFCLSSENHRHSATSQPLRTNGCKVDFPAYKGKNNLENSQNGTVTGYRALRVPRDMGPANTLAPEARALKRRRRGRGVRAGTPRCRARPRTAGRA